MPRTVRDEREIAATVAALPGKPPKGWEAFVLEKNNRLLKEVLLYRSGMMFDNSSKTRRKMTLVHCTACGEEAYLEYQKIAGCGCRYGSPDAFGFIDPADGDLKKSYSACVCPMCGAKSYALYAPRINYEHEIDSTIIESVHNVKGHLAVLSWYIKKSCDKSGKVFFTAHRWAGALIVSGVAVRLNGHCRVYPSGTAFYSEWKAPQKFEDHVGECFLGEIMPFDEKIIEETDSAKSGFEDYLRAPTDTLYPASYLQLWAKYPQVENLARQGLSRIVDDMIRSCVRGKNWKTQEEIFQLSEVKSLANWKEVKPHRILGIENDELDLARKLSLDEILFYAQVKKHKGVKLEEKLLRAASALGLTDLLSLVTSTEYGKILPVVRTINDLTKQAERDESKDKLISPSYFKDYLDAARKVYGDTPAEILFPKDLRIAHDEMILRVVEKEDPEINERMRKRFEEIRVLEYTSEELGLFIRPCATHSEIIKEGKLLKHCVARYADDHSRGKTTIFFIRKISEPEIPYYTLEYRNGGIVQNRGYKNGSKTPTVSGFELEWLAYLNNYKEFIRNGKISSRNQELARAGA